MKSICQGLLARYAEQAERRLVTIDLSLCPEPATVIGFEPSLRESLEGLVENALSSMPARTRLMIRVERDHYVTIEIICPARAHTSLSDATITAHNGLIWSSRQPDGGTRLTVELRAAGPARPVAA